MAGTRNYDFLVSLPKHSSGVLEVALLLIWDFSAFTLDQIAADRRLWRRKVMLSSAIQRGFVHPFFHYHHRDRLQDPHDRVGRQESETTDLGYSRPGAFPHYHNSVLPWCNGYSPCL